MKTIKILKKSLNIILFLGLTTITLNALNTTLKEDHSDKVQKDKVENIKNSSKTDDALKQGSEFKNYQKWDNDYDKDKYQKGSISTH